MNKLSAMVKGYCELMASPVLETVSLGIRFYAGLCAAQDEALEKIEYSKQNDAPISEEDSDVVEYCLSNLGYFISNEHHISTWKEAGTDFNVGDLTTALRALERLSTSEMKEEFSFAIEALEANVKLLGKTNMERTRNIISVVYKSAP